MGEVNEDIEKGRTYLKLSIGAYERIEDAYKQVEKKIGVMFNASLTIVTIVAGLGYFILKERLTIDTLLFVLMGLAFLFVAVSIGFYLHRLSDFNYFCPKDVFVDRKDESFASLLYESATEITEINDENTAIIASKEKWVNYMMFLIFAGLVLAILSFIFFGANALTWT